MCTYYYYVKEKIVFRRNITMKSKIFFSTDYAFLQSFSYETNLSIGNAIKRVELFGLCIITHYVYSTNFP